ncbi:unnamed protein product [Diabrotica balteata]|uniref:PH domain-containing protein n=1 Tax=Diabrotica balteata TaxID=107213 RepID=A0A9N9T009_DIABA|nr:unnamed protein product [Diabrotica balteata]
MDAFTESILNRARERQKLLESYGGTDRVPLKDANSLSSEPQKGRKESLSDSNISVNVSTKNLETQSKENKSEGNLAKFTRQNSRTKVSSDMPASPKNQLKTLNIQQDDFNMEIKLTASEKVRVEVEIAEALSDNDDMEGGCPLRIESKSKLKRLGQLYAGGEEAEISSPIHKTEEKFYSAEEVTVTKQKTNHNTPCSKAPKKGLSSLVHLAETINQWEDDIHPIRQVETSKSSPKKTWKPPAPQPPTSNKNSPIKTSVKPKAPAPPKEVASPVKNPQSINSPFKIQEQSNKIEINKRNDTFVSQTSPANQSNGVKKDLTTQIVGVIAKQVSWDQNVLDKLESQGFTRTNSNSRLVYSYNSQENIEINANKQQNHDRVQELQSIQEDPCTEDDTKHAPTINNDDQPKENKIRQMATAIQAKIDISEQHPSPVKAHIRSNNIAERAAAFENSPSKSTKDPALLSVSERKALFEKNKGEALVPKAAFGMAPPVKVETTMKASCTKIIGADKTAKPALKPVPEKEKTIVQVELVKPTIQSPPKTVKKLAPKPPAPPAPPTLAYVPQAGGIASKMAALLKNKSTISQEQIESSVKSERQREMDMLLNRFHTKETVNVIKEVSDEEDDDEADATERTVMIPEKPAKIVSSENERRKSGEKRKSGGKPYGKGDSPVVAAVLDDVKRIKVTGPKEGKLYPNLSDIEATTETEPETYTRSPSPDNSNSSFETSNNSDDPNTSFGREIIQAVCKNQTPQKRAIFDESTASDVSSILDDMDNYLDELSNEDNTSAGPTPPKLNRQQTPLKTVTQSSSSFSYKNYSPCVNTPNQNLPDYVVEGDNILPLTHTVSFYRKQQNQIQSPVRQIIRQPILEEPISETHQDETKLISEKIKELQEDVHRQQNIISQTSQALNLCSCTPEFSGSTEQVEAERVLLVATHRRQAALQEIQRLKVEGTIRPQGQHAKNVPLEKGTLTISDIVLPLKHKYVKALAAAGGKGHHVVCLIKCGEQVIPTKLTSTVVHSVKNPDTDLVIPGSVVLSNIYSDFTITFEVYCLQAQEEFLPHEVKYHINSKKSNNKLVTPKKSKQESRMVMPIKESPAGPQAVRTSSFAMMGYVVFSVQAVNKRIWNLNNTPPMSPLDGTVEMRICCELAVSVEHRGFLTMFEDVSGFGAWHRRWCMLNGQTLSYWKYPDDEKKMAPINSIDLNSCITKEVGPVNRDICARLHTILLEMERPAYSTDKDSLVTICKGDKTVIRHLLSADTKQERIEWCTKFNAALTAIRMWGNSQQ